LSTTAKSGQITIVHDLGRDLDLCFRIHGGHSATHQIFHSHLGQKIIQFMLAECGCSGRQCSSDIFLGDISFKFSIFDNKQNPQLVLFHHPIRFDDQGVGSDGGDMLVHGKAYIHDLLLESFG
jgi:hypothetical protein